MKQIRLIDGNIILNRKPITLWISANSCRYLCTIEFYNSINILTTSITLSEADISKFVEDSYEYLEFNMPNTDIYFNSTSVNLNSFGFRLNSENNNDILTLIEYNPAIDYFAEKIKINLSGPNNYNLQDFLIDIYSYFLGDIPDLTYLSPDFIS